MSHPACMVDFNINIFALSELHFNGTGNLAEEFEGCTKVTILWLNLEDKGKQYKKYEWLISA